MGDHERPPFLRTAPVHLDFLRTLDELAASRPPRRTEAAADKAALQHDEGRWAWHMPSHPGGSVWREPRHSSPR